MSWLDASEVFLMDVVSRDRVDDLRSTIDVSPESVDTDDETPREVREAREGGHWWCRRVSAARA
jgi:hypothetical protein